MVILAVCTALYDYTPQSEQELAITEGDLLYIVEKSGEDDWWKAKKRPPAPGEDEPIGLIPNNYVEDVGLQRGRIIYASGHEMEDMSTRTARALYDYARQTDEEVSFDEEAVLDVFDKESDPDWTLVGLGKEYGFAPANYIEIVPLATAPTAEPTKLVTPPKSQIEEDVPSNQSSPRPHIPDRSVSSSPHVEVSPVREVQPAQAFPVPKSQDAGFRMYHISEMASTMGKSKKLPTSLGINLASGVIMIDAGDRAQEWAADKLTHYSIEGKHVFVELVKPSRSIDFHAGQKDTAQEIVSLLGEIAGTARAGGLREILEAAGSGQHKTGKILYDFVAQGSDEVTVGMDDQVIVVDDSKSDEWWMVRRLKNGQEGVVPSSYVEVTRNAPTNAARSVVEQNRLEEQRLAREAVANGAKDADNDASLPRRGSSRPNEERKRNVKFQGRGPDTSKIRTWTDRSGSFKVEAQFIGLKDGKIHLHKLNGVKIAVPVNKMAVEDLEYVERVTGQSLDDDKPLSDIKRRSTQKNRAGASIDSPRPPPKDQSQYDWFDFFLKAGVSPYQCERYAYNFNKDSMDENILADISPSVLRTLGLKEGDILRVMKYLDAKFDRNGVDRVEGSPGGLFSGAGGALANNTRKGRPAPPVQSNDVVDGKALRPKLERTSTPLGPPTPLKDGFEDDTWDVRPSRKASASAKSGMSGNLLDLSLLQEPLKPTTPTAPIDNEKKAGANAALFQKVDQTGLGIESSRQRPQPPPVNQQSGSLMPPPPARPLSAPQTSAFAQPSINGISNLQIAPPGQSLNELNQQRYQEALQQSALMPQYNPYLGAQPPRSPFADPRMPPFQPQPFLPQSTGFQAHLQPQSTGFQSQLHPQATGYQPQLQPHSTGFQPHLQPQSTGYQTQSLLPPALQPQQTGARPAFGQAPPVPVTRLIPQQTGPAPPVRFGAATASKLQPQSTGRKANLDNATPSNPFGF